MNAPKTDSEFEPKSLNKFNYESHYHDYINYYDLHKSMYDAKKSAKMQSEQITLSEINAGLWVKAVYSAANSVTKHTYSHYIILQKFINYLMYADSTENFGLIENYFWRLLLTHPPSTEMFDFYSHILLDNFVCLNGKDIENQPLFFCLMETILNCLKAKMNALGDKNSGHCEIRPELEVKTKPARQLMFKNVKDSFYISNKSSEEKVTQTQFDFNKLPLEEKIKRCLIVINFIHKILETDFIFWLDSNEFKSPIDNNRPLLSILLWKNYRDFGSVNDNIKKLFHLYKLALNLDSQYNYIIGKLVALVGEIIRWSDSFEETKYPFVGTNCVNFSRELSLVLYHQIKNNVEENELLRNLKLPWLQLLLSSQLLTLITSHQCFPDLKRTYDILEYIVHAENKSTNRKIIPVKSPRAKNSLFRKKFKNVNEIQKNGKTYLHLACENNDTEKIKTLLTFPELDVNAVDENGWTPLHLAAHEGKVNSVQVLLLFNPEPGSGQKLVNTRAQGPRSTTPLMCAASQGHTKICKLLLEHSGSILLEDVNEFNQTAMEITNASAVKRVLNYYKSNNACTKNELKDIQFDLNFVNKKVVMRLCVEMIQAYFSTYKTWKICKRLKQSEKITEDKTDFDVEFYCDYLRYDNDIKTNINKLKSLLPQLESIEEFKSLSDIYKTVLSLS